MRINKEKLNKDQFRLTFAIINNNYEIIKKARSTDNWTIMVDDLFCAYALANEQQNRKKIGSLVLSWYKEQKKQHNRLDLESEVALSANRLEPSEILTLYKRVQNQLDVALNCNKIASSALVVYASDGESVDACKRYIDEFMQSDAQLTLSDIVYFFDNYNTNKRSIEKLSKSLAYFIDKYPAYINKQTYEAFQKSVAFEPYLKDKTSELNRAINSNIKNSTKAAVDI